MIEVKALNLESWNEPISQEQAEHMCAGLNSVIQGMFWALFLVHGPITSDITSIL